MEEKVVFKAPKMEIAPFSRAKVTIIIPFYGQYEKVTRLIRSILIATRSNPYEILLVDDCSPNKRFIATVEGTPQVKVARTPYTMGMGGALKFGFNMSKQPWVVFMNSDCVVEKHNWLVNLGKTLIDLRNEKVKMVSARMDNVTGYTNKLIDKADSSKNHYILTEEDGPLPLICTMCHRDLFKNIGGFVKNYPLGYEDEELSYRMNQYGYKQAISGTSWVKHEGGATMNQLFQSNPEEFNAKTEASREMCLEDIRNFKK